jgi:hypothetical protein
MDEQAEVENRLNATKYLYLTDFGPTDDLLGLRLEVAEGLVAPAPVAQSNAADTGPVDGYEKVLEVVTANSSAIEITDQSLRFTIIFDRCLAHCLRDETFTNPEAEEDYSRKLRTYQQSRFLDFVNASTWTWEDDRRLRHYAVVCLNVVVDIVCQDAPRIEQDVAS